MDETRHEDAEHAVGVVFRLTRRRLRLSQRELADLLGWDPSAVGRWESGHVSTALGRVDGVLRGMGFRLAVIPLDAAGPENWDTVDLPIEHIADRALRKFPAHLDHLLVEHRPFHWWLRYQDEPSPTAPNWTYRRRRPDQRPAEDAGAAPVGEAGGGDG